jgi:dTDP-4-amino-4,6-dideoxygalactose transaminase
MFNIVSDFESLISNFYNAPYAVATDCCTHAIELCLRLKEIKQTSCPKHTYLSIPMIFKKINIQWHWEDKNWENFYRLGDTNIIDAAVFWKENGYIPGTMMCLSFQFRKHLSLGRGGMILLDNKEDYHELIKMSYDGRTRDKPWAEQTVSSMGYHYYMTPETAQLGIEKFIEAKNKESASWNYSMYPDLSRLPIFN